MKNIKLEKLNSLILRELTLIIKKEYINTPDLNNIIIHEVITSNDFGQCKIYYSVVDLNTSNLSDLKQLIERHKKNIRYKLAQKLDIYKTPELKFIYDETLDNANKIEAILNKNLNDEKSDK